MNIFSSTTGALLVSGLALTACTEGPNSNRNVGVAVGALAGALAGQAVDSNRRNTLIGAAIGAAAGGAIGYNLDQQEAELRQNLQGSGVGIENTGEQLVVTLPENITFATGSATLSPSAQNQISVLASSLRQYANSRVDITGHTDSVGDASYNQTLSERRASSVASTMVANGISASRLIVSGAGESRPIATNDTDFGRAQNRRVEIVITPIAQ